MVILSSPFAQAIANLEFINERPFGYEEVAATEVPAAVAEFESGTEL